MADIAIASIALATLAIAVLSAWEGVKMWRLKRKWDEFDRQQRCVENDICIECGECYLDHINHHGRFNHTFTNRRI